MSQITILGELSPGSTFMLPGNEYVFTLVKFGVPNSHYPDDTRAYVKQPWCPFPSDEQYQIVWPLTREVIPVQQTLF